MRPEPAGHKPQELRKALPTFDRRNMTNRRKIIIDNGPVRMMPVRDPLSLWQARKKIRLLASPVSGGTCRWTHLPKCRGLFL